MTERTIGLGRGKFSSGEPTPVNPQVGEAPTCGNCCHFKRNPAQGLGTGSCTALPPQLMGKPGGPTGLLTMNMHPSLPADKLGCGLLWNVNFATLQLMANAAAVILGIPTAADAVGSGATEATQGARDGQTQGQTPGSRASPGS